MVEKIFTVSQRRVIRALLRLDRWATANEIATWADGMSWNTANKVLSELVKENIVEKKIINDAMQWRIKNLE